MLHNEKEIDQKRKDIPTVNIAPNTGALQYTIYMATATKEEINSNTTITGALTPHLNHGMIIKT